MRTPALARAFVLTLAFASALQAQAQVYPGKTWETDSKALDPKIKKRVDEYVRALDTTGLVVVKGGKIAYSYGDTKVLSYLASTRKSVLSMLYGKYVANGTIDLNKTLADLNMDDIPVTTPAENGSTSGPTTIPGLLDIEKKAKVRDLIMARSGVFHPASNPGDFLAFAPKRGTVEPGSYWLYSNWDFNAAGGAFEKMTGKKIFDALRDDLAMPIGMQDFDRKRQQMLGDPKRSKYMAYHMWLSTRDMARLGYLMLRGGKWNDKQVIPVDWVKESVSPLTKVSELNPEQERTRPWGYGYLWWPYDGASERGNMVDAYTSRGAFGQFIAVLPKVDIAVAHKVIPVNRFVTDLDWDKMLRRLAGDTPASEIILPILEKKGREIAVSEYEYLKQKPDVIADDSDLYAVGVAADREKDYKKAERALSLNLALYPKSSRSLYALGCVQLHHGKRRDAVETFRKLVHQGPFGSRAQVQLAEMGEPVDGRSFLKAYPHEKMDKVAGRYHNKDWRYVVERKGSRLYIREIDPMGEMIDEYLAFPESRGGYYVPADGTTVTFEMGAKGNPKAIVRTIGAQKQRGARQSESVKR